MTELAGLRSYKMDAVARLLIPEGQAQDPTKCKNGYFDGPTVEVIVESFDTLGLVDQLRAAAECAGVQKNLTNDRQDVILADMEWAAQAIEQVKVLMGKVKHTIEPVVEEAPMPEEPPALEDTFTAEELEARQRAMGAFVEKHAPQEVQDENTPKEATMQTAVETPVENKVNDRGETEAQETKRLERNRKARERRAAAKAAKAAPKADPIVEQVKAEIAVDMLPYQALKYMGGVGGLAVEIMGVLEAKKNGNPPSNHRLRKAVNWMITQGAGENEMREWGRLVQLTGGIGFAKDTDDVWYHQWAPKVLEIKKTAAKSERAPKPKEVATASQITGPSGHVDTERGGIVPDATPTGKWVATKLNGLEAGEIVTSIVQVKRAQQQIRTTAENLRGALRGEIKPSSKDGKRWTNMTKARGARVSYYKWEEAKSN